MLDAFLAEFDQEMGATRRVLERAPAASFAWRPHEKSWTMGGLTTHLSQIPHWGIAILERDGYDVVKDAGAPAVEKATPADVLAAFDAHVSAVRALLAQKSGAELQAPWTLSRAGEVLLSVPRIGALKSFVINHTIHHRGQLTVYLRLQNVSLPAIYGPTADEPL